MEKFCIENVCINVPFTVIVGDFTSIRSDGGYTDLHTLWINEENAAVAGRQEEIWHTR
jgi:hypothetical protein